MLLGDRGYPLNGGDGVFGKLIFLSQPDKDVLRGLENLRHFCDLSISAKLGVQSVNVSLYYLHPKTYLSATFC